MTSTPVFAEPEELMDLVLDESKQPGRDYVIVDVRDVDYAVRIQVTLRSLMYTLTPIAFM